MDEAQQAFRRRRVLSDMAEGITRQRIRPKPVKKAKAKAKGKAKRRR